MAPPHMCTDTAYSMRCTLLASMQMDKSYLVEQYMCAVCINLQSYMAGSDGCAQQQHHEEAAGRAQVNSCSGVAAEEAAGAAARGAGDTQGAWVYLCASRGTACVFMHACLHAH